MTRQYLIGELTVRLERLQATTAQAVPELARLRAQVETGPVTGLASATARAMALADELCWDSQARFWSASARLGVERVHPLLRCTWRTEYTAGGHAT